MDGILMYFRCKQTLPAKTSCSDVGARKQRIIVSSMFFVHFVLTLCVVFGVGSRSLDVTQYSYDNSAGI